MAENLCGIVEITGSCFNTMQWALVEAEEKEAIGFISGIKRKENYNLTGSYKPLATKGSKEKAWIQDEKAIDRLIKLDKAKRKRFGGLKSIVRGMYHSHIYKDNEYRSQGLSKEDIQYFKELTKRFELSESIQIVLALRLKKHNKAYPIIESIIKYPKSLRVILRYEPNYTFDYFISAYNLSQEGSIREMKVEERKVKFIKLKQ